MTIDILLPVYDGMPYLEEQIRSLQAQTHRDWRLWVRDDGSRDRSREAVLAAARKDPRIRPVGGDGGRIGARAAFGWLLANAGGEGADYTMFCDQDDVWLPHKIERSLAAMRRAEAAAGAGVPVLVHTDLAVVDASLEVLDPSFWKYQGIHPELNGLNRLLMQNTVTGCTAMINRALRDLGGPIPAEAIMHDWWLALVASAFGRIVPLREATVLYRQHDRNDTGARRRARGAELVRRALRSYRSTGRLRDGIRSAAAQAAALQRRFEGRLPAEVQRTVSRFAELPGCGPVARRWRIVQLGTLTHGGLVADIGLVLRA
jgi:glycosyltransferase involved in cell wall biosynthesis